MSQHFEKHFENRIPENNEKGATNISPESDITAEAQPPRNLTRASFGAKTRMMLFASDQNTFFANTGKMFFANTWKMFPALTNALYH